MSDLYFHIPATSKLAPKLKEHFAKVTAHQTALAAALKAWGAKSVRIYDEGTRMNLTGMAGMPGWKLVKSTNTYKPDTKTPEGVKIMERMKQIPVVGISDLDLSNHLLNHGHVIIKGSLGLMMPYAQFFPCKKGKGWVFCASPKLRKPSKDWPRDAIEITGSEFTKLSGVGLGD